MKKKHLYVVVLVEYEEEFWLGIFLLGIAYMVLIFDVEILDEILFW